MAGVLDSLEPGACGPLSPGLGGRPAPDLHACATNFGARLLWDGESSAIFCLVQGLSAAPSWSPVTQRESNFFQVEKIKPFCRGNLQG